MSKYAPLERALAALETLETLPGFAYTAETRTRVRQRLSLDGRTIIDFNAAELLTDHGTRLLVDGQPNLCVQRALIDPLSGADSLPLAGEARCVAGRLYVRGDYATPAPVGFPPAPEGWVRILGQSSSLYWRVFNSLYMGELVERLRGDAAALLAGCTAYRLRKILTGSFASAVARKISFDGRPAEFITVRLHATALNDFTGGLLRERLLARGAYEAMQGTPIAYRFILAEDGSLLRLERRVRIDLQDLISSFPPGARWSLHASQELAVQILAAAPAVALAPGEMANSPALSAVLLGPNPSFRSLAEFDERLNAALEGGGLDDFYQGVIELGQMPLIFGRTAVFLYRGPGAAIQWHGDWSGSVPVGHARLGGTDLWIEAGQFPDDARLEYQLQVDGGGQFVDPLNPQQEIGGFGSRSVFAMPGYVFPNFILPQDGVQPGELSDDLEYFSPNLGYALHYRVYVPAGYAHLYDLPVLYVADGQDYLRFARLNVILDNLIAAGKIRPLIAVFLDPRDINSGENLRSQLFLDNPRYTNFIAEELVPAIDRAYPTQPSPAARAILGASYGGYLCAYLALHHSADFHLIAMQSPSIRSNLATLQAYKKIKRLPLKIFMSVGALNDGTYHTRLMRAVLEEKGYPLLYIESSEGHSYGNWRGKLDRMLEYFFGLPDPSRTGA